MLRIQRYKSEYLDALKAAFNDIFDSSEIQYFDKLQIADMSFIGVDRNGEIKAFIIVSCTPDKIASYEISYVGVSNRYRQKGYGTRLIELVKNAVEKNGVWLNVLDSNTKGCALYEKLGFERINEFPTATNEKGIVYLYGVHCWHCDKQIGGKQIHLEKQPTQLNFVNNTFSHNEKTVRVCWHCRTRVES